MVPPTFTTYPEEAGELSAFGWLLPALPASAATTFWIFWFITTFPTAFTVPYYLPHLPLLPGEEKLLYPLHTGRLHDGAHYRYS